MPCSRCALTDPAPTLIALTPPPQRQADPTAWKAFLQDCQKVRSVTVPLASLGRTFPPQQWPHIFCPALRELNVALQDQGHLLERFLSPHLTSLSLSISTRQGEADAAKALQELAPQLHSITKLTLKTPLDVPWWWDFIEHIDTSQLQTFGFQQCPVPHHILTLIPTLPHLTHLYLDGSTITYAEDAIVSDTTDPVLSTLAQMNSTLLELLWVRAAHWNFKVGVVTRFSHLRALHLQSEGPATVMTLRTLTSLKLLEHVSVSLYGLQTWLSPPLFHGLFRAWPGLRSLSLEDLNSIFCPGIALRLKDLGNIGHSAPNLRLLRVTVKAQVVPTVAPYPLPDGTVLDLLYTHIGWHNPDAITAYLKALNLQHGAVVGGHDGEGWSTLDDCFGHRKSKDTYSIYSFL